VKRDYGAVRKAITDLLEADEYDDGQQPPCSSLIRSAPRRSKHAWATLTPVLAAQARTDPSWCAWHGTAPARTTRVRPARAVPLLLPCSKPDFSPWMGPESARLACSTCGLSCATSLYWRRFC